MTLPLGLAISSITDISNIIEYAGVFVPSKLATCSAARTYCRAFLYSEPYGKLAPSIWPGAVFLGLECVAAKG